jgi:hypothetical protein
MSSNITSGRPAHSAVWGNFGRIPAVEAQRSTRFSLPFDHSVIAVLGVRDNSIAAVSDHASNYVAPGRQSNALGYEQRT